MDSALPPIFAEYWKNLRNQDSTQAAQSDQKALTDILNKTNLNVANTPISLEKISSINYSKALQEANNSISNLKSASNNQLASEFALLKNFKVLPSELLEAIPLDTTEGYDSKSCIDTVCAEVQSNLYNSEAALDDLLAWKNHIVRKTNLPSSVKLSLAVLCSRIYRARSELHEPLFELIKEARCHSREWSLKQEAVSLLELKFQHQECFVNAAVSKIEFLENELRNERSRRIANRWEQLVSRLLAVQRMMLNSAQETGENKIDKLGAAGYIPGASNVSRFFKTRLMKQNVTVQTDPVQFGPEKSGKKVMNDTDELELFALTLDQASSGKVREQQKLLEFLRLLKGQYAAFAALLSKLQYRSIKRPISNKIAYYTYITSKAGKYLDSTSPIRKRAISEVHIETLYPEYDFTLNPLDSDLKSLRNEPTVLSLPRCNSDHAIYRMSRQSQPMQEIASYTGEIISLRRFMPQVLLRGRILDSQDQDINDLLQLENKDRISIQNYVQDVVDLGTLKFEHPHLAAAATSGPSDTNFVENGVDFAADETSSAALSSNLNELIDNNEAIAEVQRTLDATELVLPGMVNAQLETALRSFPTREDQQKSFSMLDMMKLSILHAQQLWFMHTAYQQQLQELQANLKVSLGKEAQTKQAFQHQLEVENARNRVLQDDYLRLKDSYGRQSDQLNSQRQQVADLEKQAEKKMLALTQKLTLALKANKLQMTIDPLKDDTAFTKGYNLDKNSAHKRSIFKIPNKNYTERQGAKPLAAVSVPFQWDSEASKLSFLDRMSYFAHQRLENRRKLREDAAARVREQTESQLVSQSLLAENGEIARPRVLEAEFMPLPQIKNPKLDPTTPLKMFLDRTGHIIASPWGGKFKQGKPVEKVDYDPAVLNHNVHNLFTNTITTETTTTTTTTTTTLLSAEGYIEDSIEGNLYRSNSSIIDICNLFEIAKHFD